MSYFVERALNHTIFVQILGTTLTYGVAARKQHRQIEGRVVRVEANLTDEEAFFDAQTDAAVVAFIFSINLLFSCME